MSIQLQIPGLEDTHFELSISQTDTGVYNLVNKENKVIYTTKDAETAQYFQKYNTNEIVLIFSGGLDSTTVLYDLLDKGYKVLCMSVNYGQKHLVELERAKQIAEMNNCEFTVLDLSNVEIFKASGLVTGSDKEIKDGMYDEETIQSTMVLNRNSIIANYGLALAMSRKAVGIALGIHSEDQATGEIEYPDCSPQFVEALKVLAKEIDFRPYEVIVPFSGKHKGHVVERGLELNVPYDLTWSCYKGEDEDGLACGKCGTCIQRLNAFEYNNAIDPIKYAV